MAKALFVSVGTGVGSGDEAVQSLVEGIAFSVENNHPDRVFLVVSPESQAKTLPYLRGRISMPQEVILIEQPDNIQAIYENLLPKFEAARKEFDYLAVDYTSGTKAMTSALAILGTIFEADALTYVTGKRVGGIVSPGTEVLQTIRPYFAIAQIRTRSAIGFFDECRFDTALAIIREIKQSSRDPEILSKLAPLEQASLAYSAWDKFDHREAFRHLKGLKLEEFGPNKAFLGRLLSARQREPYLIADLINNARRRGEVEGKWDDSVARLYRTIELVGQYELKKCGIEDTGRVRVEDLPEELRLKWGLSGEKTKLGLERGYELLAAKGKSLGREFLGDLRLRELLSRRNSSILAHGLRPITEDVYRELLNRVMHYASAAVGNLEELLSSSTFVRWPR